MKLGISHTALAKKLEMSLPGVGFLVNLVYGYISSDVPIVRYGADGHVPLSDLELMDEPVMEEMLTRTSRRK